MNCCEICGREFKSRSGLTAHQRLVHYSEPSPNCTHEQLVNYSKPSTQALSRTTSPTTSELEQFGPIVERIKGQIMPLIERIGPAIEGIEDRLTERLTPLLERFCEDVLPAHKGRLCQDGACSICQESRAKLVGEAEKRVHGLLEQAAQALGMTEEADRLASAYNNLVLGRDPLDGITDPNAMYVNIEGLGLLRVVDDPPPTQQYEFYHNKSGNLAWGIPQ